MYESVGAALTLCFLGADRQSSEPERDELHFLVAGSLTPLVLPKQPGGSFRSGPRSAPRLAQLSPFTTSASEPAQRIDSSAACGRICEPRRPFSKHSTTPLSTSSRKPASHDAGGGRQGSLRPATVVAQGCAQGIEWRAVQVTEHKDLRVITDMLAKLLPSSQPHHENLVAQFRSLRPSVVVPTLRLTIPSQRCDLLIDVCEVARVSHILACYHACGVV